MAVDAGAGAGKTQPENGIYEKIAILLRQWEELVTQLEQKEKRLHDDVIKAIDQEKMQTILAQIKSNK